MKITAERDGPDYTGRVLIGVEGADLDGIEVRKATTAPAITAVEIAVPAALVAEAFGAAGDVLQQIEANTDPS